MRGALVVGIDYYEHHDQLFACSNDAIKFRKVLSDHYNGSPNFDVDLEVSKSKDFPINRTHLRDKIKSLFGNEYLDVALFYFSGHGYIEQTGGYLITSEVRNGDQGLSMSDVLSFVRDSKATNKIIILDCCHSGALGQFSFEKNSSYLPENTIILTASGQNEFAIESGGSSLFTSLILDALDGSAADLSGHITPGSLYTHVDQSLGAMQQRPMFKANVNRFISLRKTEPPISFEKLKLISTYFQNQDSLFQLNPSFEFSSDSPDEDNVATFKILQEMNQVNLVTPTDPEHYMYFAAMNSGSCELTVMGQHYWNLIKKNRIRN